jgi:hypothetical protein
MIERRHLDHLVSELARKHRRQLERHPDDLEASERRFLDALQKEKQIGLSEAEERRSRPRAPRYLGLTISLATVAVLGLGLGVRAGRVGPGQPSSSTSVTIGPERTVSGSSAPAERSAAMKDDPCAHRIRASGTDPLIDDFEDGDSLVSPREGRGGAWMLFKDNDPPGALPLLTPSRRSPATVNNKSALRVTSDELRDWGASIQFDFHPSCYDASAYGGLGFSAKGPGRLYLAVREMRVVPEKWGGTCLENCYDTHRKKIDLTAAWHGYVVAWSELRQRGYHSTALDPARIHDVALMVEPADTPFDLWIDDVRFVAQPEPSSRWVR